MIVETLPYHLRLNKNVERQVFLDLLSRVSAYKPIRNYSYFGFGGPFLEDFKLLHNHFEITQMYSIEMSDQVIKRQTFNKPTSCVSCTHGTSSDLIDDFETKNTAVNAIVWFDYTSPSELGDQFLEFQRIIEKLTDGSVIKITINANPASLQSKSSLPELVDIAENQIQKEERLRKCRSEKLETRLGKHFFLRNVMIPEMMKTTKYPIALFKGLLSTAHKALEGRNTKFQPICAFKYSDGQQMLTLTGIILDEDNIATFNEQTAFEEWEYHISKNNGEPIEINVPFLSIAEKLHIDQYLPSKFNELLNDSEFQLDNSEHKTKKSLQNYQRFYRFYPNFSKVWV